jgi:hypothetical protein
LAVLGAARRKQFAPTASLASRLTVVAHSASVNLVATRSAGAKQFAAVVAMMGATEPPIFFRLVVDIDGFANDSV